jgi:3-hydroxyisobutyrate dehydrogenase
MGLPMARNLAKAGLSVRAWNRTRERAEPLRQDGIEVFDDPSDAAAGCRLLVTMLSDASAVLDYAAPALASLDGDGIWIQMSTIGIEGLERCEELAARRDAQLVDAPVLGTREPAEGGELVVLASGPDRALEECEPVFEAVGKRTLRLGGVGAGTRTKLVINNWIIGLTAVLAETISLAEVLGVDPHQFFVAIDGGPLDLPYAHLKGEAMIEHSFEDVAFRLALARKDAELTLAAAESGRLATPVLDAVARRLHQAEQMGHGDEDMAATYCATAPNGQTARA